LTFSDAESDTSGDWFGRGFPVGRYIYWSPASLQTTTRTDHSFISDRRPVIVSL